MEKYRPAVYIRLMAMEDSRIKPSIAQYFFAQDWPIKIWLAAVAVLSLYVAIKTCDPSTAAFHDWGYLLLMIVVVVLAPVFACYISLLFAWVFLGPFYYVRGRLNGAPFHPGDEVQILVGPNCGRVARVEQVWKERRQVVLETGEPRKRGFKFAFSFSQVCRVPAPHPETGPLPAIHKA